MGHTKDTAGGADTVNDAAQLVLKQLFEIDHETVVEPPQILGADGFVGVLVNVPPLLMTDPSHAVNSASTWVWV